MIFIVLIALGIVGTIGTIWLSSASLRYLENPIPSGNEWFSVSPEKMESMIGMKIRQESRKVLKIVLIWLIGIYRKISQKITLKQTVKKHVRGILYDHAPEGVRHPSEFWNQVKSTTKRVHKKRTPKTKGLTTEHIIEDVEIPSDIVEHFPTEPTDQDVTFTPESDTMPE